VRKKRLSGRESKRNSSAVPASEEPANKRLRVRDVKLSASAVPGRCPDGALEVHGVEKTNSRNDYHITYNISFAIDASFQNTLLTCSSKVMSTA
jgi:hypothetical protein